MKHYVIQIAVAVLYVSAATSCGKDNPAPKAQIVDQTVIPGANGLTLGQLAKVFAQLPLGEEHLKEVHDAALSSTANGYDEEYTLHQLLESPGCGVGDHGTKAVSYEKPLRDLLSDYFRNEASTKAGAADAQTMLNALSESDVQIYWPFSEDWDGSYPIITFDPGYGSEYNYGYLIEKGPDGLHVVDSVYVDEEVARNHAVWVINTNDDAAYTPEDFFLPAAGASPASESAVAPASAPRRLVLTDAGLKVAGKSEVALASAQSRFVLKDADEHSAVAPASAPRRLMFKAITMLRHYDSWFRGGSEFWVKCGSVNGFSASTEAELKLYSPSVTDFMVVVQRKYLGMRLEMDSIILTDFTNQLDNLAFLITEDDGGTQSNWKCSATVKVKSKSYGFDVDIPYNEKDDIVWRGQLSASFFQAEDLVSGRFGDVILEFALE